MTLTIDLTPELEAQVLEAAKEQGLDAEHLVINAVAERLQHRRQSPHSLLTESELLQKINQGLPQKTWEQYHRLLAKRRAEQLTTDEQVELIAISDQIEIANARRIEHLAQLSQLRQIPIEELMRSLEITAAVHG